MNRVLRHRQILEYVDVNQAATVRELAALVRCSEVTLRRDLEDLCNRGLLQRTHGGVCRDAVDYEPSSAEARVLLVKEKRAIARYVVENLIQGGETVILDAGTTTAEIARELVTRRLPVTVVTNSAAVVSALGNASAAHVFVTGGEYRANIGSMVGSWNDYALSTVHADIAFLGANGVRLPEGITTPNKEEARAKQAMMEAAERVIVVTDHTKFGRVSFAPIAPLSKLDMIVTDSGIPEPLLESLRGAGVTIRVVDTSRWEPPTALQASQIHTV